eukprot:15467655-Alexandrium_andersonii.AAC.1
MPRCAGDASLSPFGATGSAPSKQLGACGRPSVGRASRSARRPPRPAQRRRTAMLGPSEHWPRGQGP